MFTCFVKIISIYFFTLWTLATYNIVNFANVVSVFVIVFTIFINTLISWRWCFTLFFICRLTYMFTCFTKIVSIYFFTLWTLATYNVINFANTIPSPIIVITIFVLALRSFALTVFFKSIFSNISTITIKIISINIFTSRGHTALNIFNLGCLVTMLVIIFTIFINTLKSVLTI